MLGKYCYQESGLHVSLDTLLLAVTALHSGLGASDVVDEEADAALGDHVRHGVADLDGDHGASGETSLASGGSRQHWHDVDDGVGAPRDDGCPACPLDLIADSLWLRILGLLEAVEEGVHDVAEWEHRQSPVGPAGGSITGALAWVAVEDHEAGEDAEAQALLLGLLWGQLHHEHDLDQEEGHGEQPVHVAVGIVEGVAGGGVAQLGAALVGVDDTLDDLAWGEGGVEGVEDADVVVEGDEGHEPSVAQGWLVALGEAAETQEEEGSGRHHASETEGGHVVDGVELGGGEPSLLDGLTDGGNGFGHVCWSGVPC